MISGLVLAGGTSTRLGQPKQLLKLEGRPMLQHVIDVASEAELEEIVVVLGHLAEVVEAELQLPPRSRVVVNADYGEGLSTSLRKGLEALDPRSEAAIILLGDQPRLPLQAITRVLDVFRVRKSPFVRAAWNGTPGHPVTVARSQWDFFRQLKGDTGARDLLLNSDYSEVEMGQPPIKDIDTWEQYLNLLTEGSGRKVSAANTQKAQADLRAM